ncbi:hypothetical protein ACHAQH_004428 [Verticillium albo-atrum]
MSVKLLASVASLLLLATPALAKTDLAGCTYSDSVVTPGHGTPYATRIWFVEDTGEICEFLDCGGGRAPPKTTVPGCGSYEGTDTYSPRFLAPSTTAAAAESTTEVVSEDLTTEAPTLEVSTSATPEPQSTTASEIESSENSSTSAESSNLSQVVSTSETSVTTVATTAPASAAESANESEATGEIVDQASTTETTGTETPNAANAMATAGAREMVGMLAGVAMGVVLL